ncbi:MAG: ABC transporter substrate-binding protein [Rhodospirillaceae bacterium]|nr:ABC transporter substrate-binding protein [Rhodospirillaceae bacterium]
MRTVLARFFIFVLFAAVLPRDALAVSSEWPSIVARARGQDVHWHAYGGDEKVNRYIQWVADEVKRRYGLTLHHVKVGNIAETVTQLVAEKAAGRTEGGRVDLMWLNGQNFAAMKENNLLFGPITHVLPRFALVDTVHKPTTLLDFTVPTLGLESPWGMAQLVFFADSDAVRRPPRTIAALREWTIANPGRFTYPAPPDFTGQTFLKQVFLETLDNRDVAYRPVREDDFQRVTAPLWRFIEGLHPHLWRKGASFPPSYAAMRQLMTDGEIDIAFAFNPAEASNAVAQKLLPSSVRSFVLEAGTIGNTHFVAIPQTASSKDGAMVVADFLLSPEAQSRKANPEHWGDPTVLSLDKLSDAERQLFEDLPRGRAMPSAADLQLSLSEPHPTWTTRIAQEWRKRYVK